MQTSVRPTLSRTGEAAPAGITLLCCRGPPSISSPAGCFLIPLRALCVPCPRSCSGFGAGGVKFLKQAVLVVIECRRLLFWSYGALRAPLRFGRTTVPSCAACSGVLFSRLAARRLSVGVVCPLSVLLRVLVAHAPTPARHSFRLRPSGCVGARSDGLLHAAKGQGEGEGEGLHQGALRAAPGLRVVFRCS